MYQQHIAKLDRFNLPAKELLVGFINKKNNRGLTPSQLVFGVPVLKRGDGLSEVEVSFDPSTGWAADDQKRTLGYFRTDLEVYLNKKPLIVHVEEDTNAALLKAILEQYGLLLEPNLIEIDLITSSLADSVYNPDLFGFEPEDVVDAEEVIPPPAYLINRNYRITFKDEHLVFIGGLDVYTRRSLEMLGTTIDSLIDLREFYTDGNFELPKADLVIPNGELYINEETYDAYINRKAASTALYETKVGPILGESRIASILRKLTGDPWIIEDARGLDFNLYGTDVIYNGFVKIEYGLQRAAYNYVLVLALGPKCGNLTGYIKIGYQFSSSKVPGNLTENFASVMPLHPR